MTVLDAPELALVTLRHRRHLKGGERKLCQYFLNYRMNQLHVKWSVLRRVKIHAWIHVLIVVLVGALENAL